MSKGKLISGSELAEMGDQKLITLIYETIKKYAQETPISRSAVEVSLAIALASEIGASCESEDAIEVNVQTYLNFIHLYALIVRAEIPTAKAMH